MAAQFQNSIEISLSPVWSLRTAKSINRCSDLVKSIISVLIAGWWWAKDIVLLWRPFWYRICDNFWNILEMEASSEQYWLLCCHFMSVWWDKNIELWLRRFHCDGWVYDRRLELYIKAKSAWISKVRLVVIVCKEGEKWLWKVLGRSKRNV